MSILTFSHLIKRAWPKRAKLFGQAQLLINIILSPFNGHIKRHHRRYFSKFEIIANSRKEK